METILQKGFGGGEIAPEFWGRPDLKIYPTSLKTLNNFKVTRASTLTKCPGSVIVNSTPSNAKVRLFKFNLPASQGILLEFSNGLLRFYQNWKKLGINSAAWVGGTTYQAGQAVTSGGNTYIALRNNGLTNLAIQPGVTTGWAAFWYLVTDTTIYNIPSPYAQADLSLISFRQVNAVLYMACQSQTTPNYPPYKLTLLTYSNGHVGFYFDLVANNPSIDPTVVVFGGTPGGTGAGNEYDYKVTIENLLTGEESFPITLEYKLGTNEVQRLSSPWEEGTEILSGIATFTYTPLVGAPITTGGINFNDSLATWQSKFDSAFGAGNIVVSQTSDLGYGPWQAMGLVQYPITFTFENQYGDQPQNLLVCNTTTTFTSEGGNLPNPGPLTEITPGVYGNSYVSSIDLTTNKPNYITIVTKAPHQLASGDQVLIYQSGVPQLDKRVFNVIVVNTTTFQIWLDSTGYGTPPTPATGVIGRTTLRLQNCNAPTLAAPNVLSWQSNTWDTSIPNGYLPNQVTYNIYAGQGGVFGFIGTTQGYTFSDPGIPPDIDFDPPTYNPIFVAPGDYPALVDEYQQRLVFACTKNNPLEFDASRTGFLENFTTRANLQSDDAVIRQSIVADAGATIQNLTDFGFLIFFTDKGETVLRGDQTGTLTPVNTNSTAQTFNGSAFLRTLKINRSILYLQAQSSLVRDLQAQITPYGFTYLATSEEVTLFAKHLVEGYSIVDWDYQRIYDSIVYAARNDGMGLGLTYNNEQQLAAYWRRTTNGIYENFCCVTEGFEDAVYACAARTYYDGSTIRLIERFSTDQWKTIQDANYLDSATVFDGRNSTIAPTTTMELSIFPPNTKWDGTQWLYLSSSTSFFNSGMVGNQIYLYGSDGYLVRFTITGYSGPTIVSGTVDRTVPDGVNAYGTDGTIHADMRNTTITTWGYAIQNLTGLTPFQSPVAVVGDGKVQSNPLNLYRGQTALTVASNGTLTIPSPAVVIYVGIPFISDIELLDMDIDPKDSQIDKKTALKKAVCMVKSTQGFWVGSENPDTNIQAPQNLPGPTQSPNYVFGLTEAKIRNQAGYDSAVDMITGRVITDFAGKWSYGSRLFIRSVDPIPCSFSAIGFGVDIPSTGK